MRAWLGYAAASGATLLLLAALAASHRHELLQTLGHLRPAVVALAVALHLATLFARAEAWRLTLLAIERRPVPRRSLAVATAAGFLAGSVETQLAMPARVGVLRRLAPQVAPRIPQMLLTDVPMMALEGVCAAALLVAAAAALPAMPLWAFPVVLVAAASGLVAIRLAHERFARRPLVQGLAILGTPGLRDRLAGLTVATVVTTIARIGLLLAACRLPADPAHMILVYLAASVLGLLPIGPASTAVATLAAAGAPTVGAATAAGLAIAATSIAAVAVYALIAAAYALVPAVTGSAAPRGSRRPGPSRAAS